MPAAKPTAPMFFDSSAAFRRWLAAHAATAPEITVGFHKVATGRPCMTWSESVDEALCVGWIDGVRKRIDEHAYQIRFTPRKPSSIWSAINIAKVAQLQAQGRMSAAGLQAYAHRQDAKSKVYAYEQAASADLSAAELAAFQREPLAWAYFEQVPPGYKKVMLHWVSTAKREETRAKRLATLMEACAAGKRLR